MSERNERDELLHQRALAELERLDSVSWGGNADGITALLEENKSLKELAERQMNDAEAARIELAEIKALLASSATGPSHQRIGLTNEEIADAFGESEEEKRQRAARLSDGTAKEAK